MDSLNFDKFIGQEVFILADAEDEDDHHLFITNSSEKMEEKLRGMDLSMAEDIRVLNGILTLAEFLPASLKNKTAYIIHVGKYESFAVETGCCYPEELASEIELQVDKEQADINEIYVLYGYEMSLCLSINPESFDEEAIDTCKGIAESAETTSCIKHGNY